MKIHIIKKGETLYALSKKYGVSLDQLIALNPQLADPNQVQVGMKIRVPSTPVSTGGYEIVHKHVVKEGDTLWKLAKAWGLPLQALIAANPQLKNPNVLLIGQVVNIPKLTANESGGPSASAGWGANAANTGVIPLSKAELTKPIQPQPPVQPPIQPPKQPPILPETKLQPQAKQPASLPSQPQAQAKPPIQSQSQPKPQLQPQYKPQAEQLILPSPLPNPPSVKPATGNVSPVKPTLKGEVPNFAPLPASYDNFSANMPNVEPYPNSFVPNYVGQSQSNVQWQSQEVGGTQSTSQPNVYPNVPQYEGFCTPDISPYPNFCNPYPVHPFGAHHCNPCGYPSHGVNSMPFMPYQASYTDGLNSMWGSENVFYSENANYGPTSVLPGANANYGPTSVSPDSNANYGPASVLPGANANYGPTSVLPDSNANYGLASVSPGANANYSPSFVSPAANQSISSSGAGEMWDKKANEQAVNAESYAYPQQYSNMPYDVQAYGAYGASPYVDYSVFCHQCGTPYRVDTSLQDGSWLSQWGGVNSAAGNEAEFAQEPEDVQSDSSDDVSASKGKKKSKEQRKNVSTRSYKESDSYTQASVRQKGKSMPWING
ncbi:LysM peptidoglycan-binding domain-containing protein [Paenibacillus sp. SC116]|uniref:LysM peptidoglycan-binding domain-containing protein n=1 Tax=Paenibacillus sp. SC116 TaxID=2968986 RepID=UPI00215B5211|nr:LysM domain-containing protein [Paenibacillus sp. SC116]MCR8846269.1 LysM peptidoglycan-binding domain-containing protein [Paenibacillus sp. SC116]